MKIRRTTGRPTQPSPGQRGLPSRCSGWWRPPATVLVAVIVVASGTASACNIPVFRYALERWQSDDYQVIIGGDTANAGEPARNLVAALGRSHCNAACSYSDRAQGETPNHDARQARPGHPRVDRSHYVVRTPDQNGHSSVVFAGLLQQNAADIVITSPVRRELSRRLLSGHAIVWLILGSADPQQNQVVRRRVEKAIARLEKQMELPAGIGLPGSELHSEVPLLLRFSVLEIAHDDPREALLRSQLADGRDLPAAVPVFGRGRALDVIAAAELNASLIDDLTIYLCGACSCQVKERNPGFDLLLDVDWERELFGDDGPPADIQQLKTGIMATSDKPRLLTIPPGKSTNP